MGVCTKSGVLEAIEVSTHTQERIKIKQQFSVGETKPEQNASSNLVNLVTKFPKSKPDSMLVLDPLLGDPGLGLGCKAVDVGQRRPFHLGANCTLTVVGVGAPVGGSTLGGRVGGFIAGDANMTWDPAVFNADASSAERGLNVEGPMCQLLAWTFVVIAEA
jgi:hypothetical protein